MFAAIHDNPGPSLPLWFLLPATAIFALLTLYWMLRTRGTAARYLIFACYTRYTIGAFHEFTYQDAFAGLRWVALGSAFLIILGVVLLDKRRLFSRPFIPAAVLAFIMIVSAILNQDVTEAIDPLLRLFFFVLTAVALWQAVESHGGIVLRRLLFLFVQPLVFQAASVVLNLPKSGEIDGSVSYIGGYYHEELFSLILITAFLVAILAKGVPPILKIGMLALSFAGIYLTDYRTSMMAALPLAILSALAVGPRAFRSDQRNFVRIMIVSFGCLALIATVTALQDRFSDLGEVMQVNQLIKPPEQYSYADQRVLSARPYIWSQYITAYVEAPALQKVIGFGPDSWIGKFPLYAHNTLISFLYETGVIGLAALLWLWFAMFRLALRAPEKERSVIVGGHLSFFLLNLATMPHWQIEGNIFYGILCGYTIAKARVAIRQRTIRFLPADSDTEWPVKPDDRARLPLHLQ